LRADEGIAVFCYNLVLKEFFSEMRKFKETLGSSPPYLLVIAPGLKLRVSIIVDVLFVYAGHIA